MTKTTKYSGRQKAAVVVAFTAVSLLVSAQPASAAGYFSGTQSCAGGGNYAGVHYSGVGIDRYGGTIAFTSSATGAHTVYSMFDWPTPSASVYSPYGVALWEVASNNLTSAYGICSW